MARAVDDLTAAFASHKIYAKQETGHEDVQTLQHIVQNFGQRAGDICHSLFRRHTRADPYGVPQTPEHSIHEEFWTLHSDSRDIEGENMVKELASYIRETNNRRQQQNLPPVLFTDPFFAPNKNSLFADPSTAGKNANAAKTERTTKQGRDLDPFLANEDISRIEWKRPHEFGDPSLRPVIYSGGIDPDDVGQGQLGNCYFLAAIQSCGSEQEDFLIRDLCIEDEEVACCGMYGVKFFLNGQWVTVLVDDRIPCKYDGRHWQPIFAKPMKHGKQETGEKELWALIFEKAWAKLNLSYESTDAGLTGDTTNYLTGGTIKQFDVDDSNWDVLRNYTADAKSVAFLSCSIRPNLPEAPRLMSTWGLMEGHAYSVLQLRRARNGQRFVQVRNPWGDHNEWKGRFSDRDRTSWTPELKHELGFVDQYDGTFWMLWDDYMYFFGTIEVCDPIAIARVTEGHHEHCRVDVFASHWIRGQTAGGPETCKTFKHNPVCILQVDTSGPVEVALYQPDVRPVQKVTGAEQLTVTLYLIDAQTGTKTELFESSRRINCHTIQHVQAGRIYHLVASAWGPGVQSAFWITAAGSGAILNAGPATQPTKEEEDIMALETPRSMCCVVCHQEDREGYYQTKEGYKCENCQKSNRRALQGKGHNPHRPPVPRAAPVVNHYNQKQPSYGQPSNMASPPYGQPPSANNNVPDLMGMGSQPAPNPFGQQPTNNVPDLMGPASVGQDDRLSIGLPSYSKGDPAHLDPAHLASFPSRQQTPSGGGAPTGQYGLATQGGGGYASIPTQSQGGGYTSIPTQNGSSGMQGSPERYGALPAEEPRSPQMQCYYCDAPLGAKYKMTQYGPCCSPPCWEGKPAPLEQARPVRAGPGGAMQRAQPSQQPDMFCYYCERKLSRSNYQMTQYGPSCQPGCWDTPNTSMVEQPYHAALNTSVASTSVGAPFLNTSAVSATPLLAPTSFAVNASPVFNPPLYGGFSASPPGVMLPRQPLFQPARPTLMMAASPMMQPAALPGQRPLMAAGPVVRPGGTVVYAKPPAMVPVNAPQWTSVPNSPAVSRRSSSQFGGFPVYGMSPGPQLAMPVLQQPYGRLPY